MKSKLLFSLILAPAVVFLFHAAYTEKPGGDRKQEKQRSGHKQENLTEPAKKIGGRQEQIELEEVLRQEVAEYEDIDLSNSENLVYSWVLEEENPELNALIESKLLSAVGKAELMEFDADKMFSRCPSGYAYVIIKDGEGELLNSGGSVNGYVIGRQGCHSRVLCVFRAEPTSENIELKISDEAGFAGIDEWMKLRKQI